MLKTVLVALNAKYIHSCPALYSLREFCPQYRESIIIREFTINQERGFILRELYACKPDIIGFSCYIWNIGTVTALAKSLKKLLPNLVIILGGPEVSYDHVDCPADVVVKGEGEQAFCDLMAYYNDGIGELEQIAGEPTDVNQLPFIYADRLEDFTNRIIYYESSRGCPFHCAYCLSGNKDSRVRVLPLKRVYNELQLFLDAQVRQVKFTDRTFNCRKDRTVNIWQYIKEHDNGITNFHFEISADLLDNETLSLLNDVRSGMFQFEIGVQSTNKTVLDKIKRHTDLSRLTENVIKLKKSGNIHLHLDLIAGLPGEDYTSFRQSFNDVYAMEPEALQLGFLKALKGTEVRSGAERYGLIYDYSPPYEVLKTDEISFDEICHLKDIESILEGFYNTGLAPCTLRYLTGAGAFEFYERIALFWREKDYHLAPLGKMGMYAALYEFCKQSVGIDTKFILELMRFDLLAREHEKNPPEWLVPKPSPEERAMYRAYKESIGADALSIQTFEYCVMNWRGGLPEKRRNTVLFRYKDGKGKGVYREITG